MALSSMNKALGASAGTGIGGSVATILVWFLHVHYGLDAPQEVCVAFGSLFTGIAAIGGTYFAPPNA